MLVILPVYCYTSVNYTKKPYLCKFALISFFRRLMFLSRIDHIVMTGHMTVAIGSWFTNKWWIQVIPTCSFLAFPHLIRPAAFRWFIFIALGRHRFAGNFLSVTSHINCSVVPWPDKGCTRDREAACLSLTGVTELWSLSKTHFS